MPADAPTNSVNLNTDGYIEVKVVGDQDYLSLDALRKESKELAIQLHYRGKPVLGLIDLTGMVGFNTGSNKAALEILEDIDYNKVAIYGASTPATAVVNLLIQALSKSDRTKLFHDRTSALAWLLGPADNEQH